MTLYDRCVHQGNVLFRWRGQLPLLLVPLFVLAIRSRVGTGLLLGPAYQAFCLGVSLLGAGIRGFTVGWVPAGTSGRNTRRQIAETLNTTGMYSLCRHPLYLGNFFVLLGMALFTACWWAVVIAVLAFWLYYERIMLAEEAFLQQKFGEVFLAWARRTPVLWPRWRAWQPSEQPFSWRKVLRREYTGLLVLSGSFTCLKLMESWFATGRLYLTGPWQLLLAVGVGGYLALRTLTKKTAVLRD